MWIARVEINQDGARSLLTFKSVAREEKTARKSILRRAIAVREGEHIEATILDIRHDEPDEFRLF